MSVWQKDYRKAGHWELAGHCGVDSGQIMFCDPCYIKNWEGYDMGDASYNNDPPEKKRQFSYEGACDATLSEFGAGQLGHVLGVAMSSGYGDGLYPVYVRKNHEGRIVEAKILFDWEEEE